MSNISNEWPFSSFFLFFHFSIAINFAKIISDVEDKQTAITTLLVNNKELLHSVKESFGSNLQGMTKEVNKIETRITQLSEKIK